MRTWFEWENMTVRSSLVPSLGLSFFLAVVVPCHVDVLLELFCGYPDSDRNGLYRNEPVQCKVVMCSVSCSLDNKQEH